GATMDWSHGLLTRPAQVLFRRLSVFSGFSLDAAEAVCGDDEGDARIDGRAVLELLSDLIDSSLVVVETRSRSGADARYPLLQTIRQYATDKLVESSEVDVTRDRHTAWCLDLARHGVGGRLQCPVILSQLEQEQDNLRGALRWCLAEGREHMGLRLGA